MAGITAERRERCQDEEASRTELGCAPNMTYEVKSVRVVEPRKFRCSRASPIALLAVLEAAGAGVAGKQPGCYFDKLISHAIAISD